MHNQIVIIIINNNFTGHATYPMFHGQAGDLVEEKRIGRPTQETPEGISAHSCYLINKGTHVTYKRP